MAEANPYQQDIDAILARRYDNGADYWATPDKRLYVGSPFTTLGSARLLSELGMDPSEPVLKETADLIFSTWREDGRFKLFPQGARTARHREILKNLGRLPFPTPWHFL